MVEMRNILRRWLPKHRKTSDAARPWIRDRETFVHRAYHQASSSHRDHPIKASKLEKREAGKRRKRLERRARCSRTQHSWCFSVNRMLGPEKKRRKKSERGRRRMSNVHVFLSTRKFLFFVFVESLLCSSFDSASFLLPRERAPRGDIKRGIVFFTRWNLQIIESSMHTHTQWVRGFSWGPSCYYSAPRYEGTAMRQSLTKGTPHGTGPVHIAASSWHAALNLIQFYAVCPFFIYEYFSQNRIFSNYPQRRRLSWYRDRKNNPSNYLPRYDVIRAQS